MKYLNEYRDPAAARKLAGSIRRIVRSPWTIMEVCGGQTHTIVKSALQDLLPPEITLLHGPGCPVCVTPIELIDMGIEIARQPNVVFCSFGDMLRVPGSTLSLLAAKAEGADVRVVYSPLDAVKLARDNAAKEVVFFAVGFETTAPANAMAVWQAARLSLRNFSLLVSHVLVPPAMEVICSAKPRRVDAFLAAGHVCTVMGFEEYKPIAERYRVPIVVTGFEPLDILQGIEMAVRQLEEARFEVENQYARAVRPEGNLRARELIQDVFEVCSRSWRGIGPIDASGLRLRAHYRAYDAESKFFGEGSARPVAPPSRAPGPESAEVKCEAGLVLQGVKKPHECPAFGIQCTPDTPLGAPMVSSEGACAAYYHYSSARYART
jgi:hydrogenase expression/formation protein HypD